MAEPMIYKAIADVMSDIGAVAKNQKNQQQGFMFRGIDQIYNALQPALVKHKVFVVPEILEQSREERQTSRGGNLIYSICKVKYTFFTTDGSSISATVIGEGMDSGDKATNKAMSIAFKYACFQVFCIPTEEMKDPDEESHEVAPKKSKESQVDGKQKISAEKIQSMTELLKKYEVKEETIYRLYNIKSLSDITEKMHENIVKNIEKIKEKQEESNE